MNRQYQMKYIRDNIIDLTRPMDSSLAVYSEEGYSDPAFKISEWCSIKDRGFAVSQVMMGTQTGTHMDAPAHFLEGGAGLESLSARDMAGRYFLIDLDSAAFDESDIRNYSGEEFLFIKCCRPGSMLREEFFDLLLDLPASVWVLAGDCGIIGSERFRFNRGLAQKGKFLVEDLDTAAAEKISTAGWIFTMPLRLVGTSGAPCRVAVIQAE